MGVPGQTAERRGLRRPRLAALGAVIAALLLYLYAPLPAPAAARPTLEDCVELHLWTNGFHTDIGAPASLFPAEHPLRKLFPKARSFLIGWGEEHFYRADKFDWRLALDAVTPPSPSVMHVAYDAADASRYLGPTDDVSIPISHAGAVAFLAYVDRTLRLDASGAPIEVAPGKLVGHSAFLRANGSFHLFNVCNQWMARALRAAGVDVNARAAWFGDALVRAARRARPEGCPHSENVPSQPILGP